MHILIALMLVCGVPGTLAHESSSVPVKKAGKASCVNDPSWMAPQQPFRIYGNTWYVGTRGISAVLITSPTGHVLIDVGVPDSVPLVEANIRRLGIKLRDIKWLLNSHAHCDHAGGMARLVKDTGAQVIASAGDVPLLERGGHDDPQFGDRFLFPPLRVTRKLVHGENLQLGNLTLTPHLTPGHTQGNTSWTWQSCEDQRCLNLAYVGSLSAPDYRLTGNQRYPHIVSDYEASFATVAALPCDIALAPHPGMVDFWERVATREQGKPDALINPALCRDYAKDSRESFEEKLAKQRAEAGAGKK